MPFTKIDDTLDKWERKIVGKAVKPDQEPVSDTSKDKMIAAGLGAIMGLSFSTLGPMLVRSIKPVWKRIPIRSAAAITLGSSLAGATAPSLVNSIVSERRGEIPEGSAEKEFKERQMLERDIENAVAAFPTFKKSAGLLTTPLRMAGNFARFGGKKAGQGALGLAKSVGEGLVSNPFSRKAGIGRRAWGLTVQGAAGFGAYKGVKAARSRRRLSGTNYTTMLRNNMLAGNIKTNEVSQADLIRVRNMGMR